MVIFISGWLLGFLIALAAGAGKAATLLTGLGFGAASWWIMTRRRN
jgi:hypothetical protein